MNLSVRNVLQFSARSLSVLALSVALGLGLSTGASADEADAKRLLKAMSDYLAAQQTLSFSYDATLEVVTAEDQILGIASSGKVALKRPDKLHATRSGGFADVDMTFDGKTLTILGKNLNKYTQIEAPGSIGQLVDHHHAFEQHGVFRQDDVDWQIWIAHGDKPYPCGYVITSKSMPNGPSYSIQIRDWKTGKAVAASSFEFKNTSKASMVKLEDLKGTGDLPEHFTKGERK